VQYICEKSGWKEDSKRSTQCRELFVELWRNLQDMADGDDDGQISVDEWVSAAPTTNDPSQTHSVNTTNN